ncbi:hypothetical protein FQR65_LT17164 [Abscondita terminalis]|nr:hypothetical protein FQR65_LT17164 [Abscondita terminalis]
MLNVPSNLENPNPGVSDVEASASESERKASLPGGSKIIRVPAVKGRTATKPSLASLAQDIKIAHNNQTAILNLSKSIAHITQKLEKTSLIKFKVSSDELQASVPKLVHSSPESIILFIESVEKILKIPNVDIPSLLTALAVKVDTTDTDRPNEVTILVAADLTT